MTALDTPAGQAGGSEAALVQPRINQGHLQAAPAERYMPHPLASFVTGLAANIGVESALMVTNAATPGEIVGAGAGTVGFVFAAIHYGGRYLHNRRLRHSQRAAEVTRQQG